MSGLTLKIDSTGNAAFTDGPREEIARILRKVANDITDGKEGGVILDVNGNKVGAWDLDLPDAED